ncbi:XRE family transcriptional regulator, partial [Enterococcus faecalis]|nr:XRE family transcriptional regulator [Enterococcus faecalis]
MVLDIGKNIQMLRCKKGLSRESLCEDESKLSVRQLTRIENENANTTISVLNFIAKQLNVAVVNLIEQKSELPRDYLKLKHKVFKTYPVIGSLERLEYKEGILELIYEKYFFD